MCRTKYKRRERLTAVAHASDPDTGRAASKSLAQSAFPLGLTPESQDSDRDALVDQLDQQAAVCTLSMLAFPNETSHHSPYYLCAASVVLVVVQITHAMPRLRAGARLKPAASMAIIPIGEHNRKSSGGISSQ